MADQVKRVILVDLGRIAYEGYRTMTDSRSLVSGAALPAWEDQTPQIREAWRGAADAVRMWLDLHPRAEETS
jgi:hypothetical protein